MKTIHLTDEQEQFLAKRCTPAGTPAKSPSSAMPSTGSGNRSTCREDQIKRRSLRPGKQLTRQQFQRHLVEIGLLDQASPRHWRRRRQRHSRAGVD